MRRKQHSIILKIYIRRSVGAELNDVQIQTKHMYIIYKNNEEIFYGIFFASRQICHTK